MLCVKLIVLFLVEFGNVTQIMFVQILAGLLAPTSGTVYVNEPKSFVFQNPDHQVLLGSLPFFC